MYGSTNFYPILIVIETLIKLTTKTLSFHPSLAGRTANPMCLKTKFLPITFSFKEHDSFLRSEVRLLLSLEQRSDSTGERWPPKDRKGNPFRWRGPSTSADLHTLCEVGSRRLNFQCYNLGSFLPRSLCPKQAPKTKIKKQKIKNNNEAK